MTENSLKAYIARAKELETAIYTHKKMMDEHRGIMAKASPVTPTEKVVPQPKKPVQYEALPSTVGSWPWLLGIFFTGLAILYIVVMVIGMLKGIDPSDVEDSGFGLVATLVLGSLGLFILIKLKEANQKIAVENDMRCKQYELALAAYNKNLNNHPAEVEKAKNEYAMAMQKYHTALDEHNNAVSDMMEKYDKILLALISALEEHYAQDVVFAKYRNLVAISTFEEYLMSGRCETLSGANGAYNLYEMELRQNVIINQLSSILSNLEQIRNNQYTLYQELVKANGTVYEILHEVQGVKETAKVAAYFAGVTAMIEASPKVYITRTF